MRIEFRCGQSQSIPDREILKKIASLLRYAAKEEGLPSCFTVTIGFCDDDRIRRFNHRFRHLDQATDVLSFPMTSGRKEISSVERSFSSGMVRPSLGDILISTERCAVQAEEYGHGFEREICFLALHGFLHLLGYDHMEEEERKEMEDAADGYLSAMGVMR